MAQLIQMRQRIKAIQTIKKITHAMRLISMSTHSRLRNRAPQIEAYQQAIDALFANVRKKTTSWKNPIMHPEKKAQQKKLLIIVGSQKGLCGNFNASLFNYLEKEISKESLKKHALIAVGKYASNYIKKAKLQSSVVKEFDTFTSSKINAITNNIVDIITKAQQPYTSVHIVANGLKSFFVQQPKTFPLIPLQDAPQEKVEGNKEEYEWEQAPEILLDDLANQFLVAKIYHILFESILAEQASRFISMDNSTRNAKELLEETQLRYNKLRQAKITRELTELAASFQN